MTSFFIILPCIGLHFVAISCHLYDFVLITSSHFFCYLALCMSFSALLFFLFLTFLTLLECLKTDIFLPNCCTSFFVYFLILFHRFKISTPLDRETRMGGISLVRSTAAFEVDTCKYVSRLYYILTFEPRTAFPRFPEFDLQYRAPLRVWRSSARAGSPSSSLPPDPGG